MDVLGLSFHYHDSAACLVRDGEVVAACAEERLCRRKHTAEFPSRAIAYVLREGGIAAADLDYAAFYEKPIRKFDRLLRTTIAAWPESLVPFCSGTRQWITEKIHVVRLVQKRLGAPVPVACVPHHVSHAASAFYLSGFDRAAILTMDGVGEWATTAIGRGEGSRLEMLSEIRYPHSLGLLYSALTAYLGFRVNDAEWKVMGLAPYGKPVFLDRFRKLARQREDGSFRLDLRYFSFHTTGLRMFSQAWCDLFGAPSRAPEAELTDFHRDIAASGQRFLEELVLGLAAQARRASGERNLCIAGGVGLNAVANWRVRQECGFDDVFVQPAAGDDGGAVGAAAFLSCGILGQPRPPRLKQVFWGPGYGQDALSAFLRARGIPHEAFPDDRACCRAAAERIAANQVLGWFQGRQEFGPRALGHRSILGNPMHAGIKDLINAKVKYREAFRPFAPSVLEEQAHRFFEMAPGERLPFMVMVPPVRPEWRERLPGITHRDGSARVQTVAPDAGAFRTLLEELEGRLGIPMVLNTSFNVRGEPIVTTPEEAYDCFCRTGIDALVLGRCLVTEKPGAVDHGLGAKRSVALEGGGR